MKYLIILFVCISHYLMAQNPIESTLVQEIPMKAEQFIGMDTFKALYYIDDNVLFKKTSDKIISYNNLKLGTITSANVFNPLKINVFYRDFNTVIVLDNRLSEIFKLDFNLMAPYRNISHVSSGYDNTLWLFNQDTQQLEVFDYKNQTTKARTLPVASQVLDMTSNYNYCWLLTKDYLLKYNYFGTMIKKIKNDGYSSLAESNENIILKKDNALFYSDKNNDTIVPVKLPNLLISQFSVTNETLYIYNEENLKIFQLKTN